MRRVLETARLYLGLGPKAAYQDGLVADHVEHRLHQIMLGLLVVFIAWVTITTGRFFPGFVFLGPLLGGYLRQRRRRPRL